MYVMLAHIQPPLQLRERAGAHSSMQACHWSHVHGINTDTNKAGVYHNPMIRLIYEDVKMHSTKI